MAYDNAGNLIEDPNTIFKTKEDKMIGERLGLYDKRENEKLIKRQNNFVEPELKKEMKYPLSDAGNHYIRFWINLDEESKLIKDNKVIAIGNVDNSDQGRLNTNSATDGTVARAAILAGAAKGGKIAFGLAKAPTDDQKKNLSVLDTFKRKGMFADPRRAAFMIGSGIVIGGVAGGLVNAIFQEDFKLSKRLKRLATSISLYIPANVSSSYHLGWTQTDDMLLDIAQKTQSDAIGNMMKNRPLEGPLRIYMSGASEAFSNLGRTAKNPRRDMLFQHVGNRKFKFEYIFAPRSKEEAQEVANIIYTFKLFAHPELLEGYANYLYLYPAEFDIEYRMIDANGKDIENPFINKISSCVLESVDVVYANRGTYQSLANGEPLMTTLSLTFMEIETLHQEKIKQGF